jgi:hypothetical protein
MEMISRSLPLSLRKVNLARLLARQPEGIFLSDFEHGEIGPDLFVGACNMGGVKAPGSPVSGWSVVKNRRHRATERVMKS